MAKKTGTLGELWVNSVLPDDIAAERPILDKKGVARILSLVAKKYPEKYKEISFALNQIGAQAAYTTGGFSFGLEDMRKSLAAKNRQLKFREQLNNILNDDRLNDESRNKKIIELTKNSTAGLADEVFEESFAEQNPLAIQILGSGRGNKNSLVSLRGGDGLYEDHRGQTIPVPVTRSYSEGLTPLEYWASTYGARQGVLATKFCLAIGTKVLLSDFSHKAIEDIVVGDKVFTLDENDQLVETTVTNTFNNGYRLCNKYEFRLGRSKETISVVATPDHKILLEYRTRSGERRRKMVRLDEAARGRKSAVVSKGHSGVVAEPRAGILGALLGDGGLTTQNTNVYATDSLVNKPTLPRRFVRYSVVGLLPTFDIEVDHPTHRFVLANGLVVSNSVQEAGTFSKQLNQINHRLLITEDDTEKEPEHPIGLPVDTDDMDSVGALLAYPVAGYKRNTIITPKILADIKKKGVNEILVRSPAVSGAPDGGLYAKDAGIREFGTFPVRGENIGLVAAQALGEPLSQSQLSAKHAGGVAGQVKSLSGFDLLNELVQIPKTFKDSATHATVDGRVRAINKAPAGGYYIMIGDEKHYVATGYKPTVQVGQRVEAGDVLSEGVPNPAMITKYKGIGEGRRYFIKTMKDAMESAGISANRRNIEILARGLINHVRFKEETDDYVPDDIVPYSVIEHTYKPREGYKTLSPMQAAGKYLERPYLHYETGAKVKPSMITMLNRYNIKQIDVHDDEPIFEPVMVRGMANLHYDPDWMTQMYGSGLKSSLLTSTQRGGVSDEEGTSFVPAGARAVEFGRIGKVITPKRSVLAKKTWPDLI